MKIFVKLVILIVAVTLGRVGYDKAIDLSFFELNDVQIKGNTAMPDDSLITLCGLEIGKSVYRQNLDYAAEVISKQKGVVNCSVNRNFISSIDIEINYAEPALCILAGELYGLSREGIVLPLNDGMPVLSLVSGRKFSRAAQYNRIKDPDVSYALELYDKMMAISPHLCARLSEINFGDNGKIKLFISPDGTELVMNKRSLDNTLRRIASMEDNGLLIGKKAFDLRFGSVVVQSGIGA